MFLRRSGGRGKKLNGRKGRGKNHGFGEMGEDGGRRRKEEKISCNSPQFLPVEVRVRFA